MLLCKTVLVRYMLEIFVDRGKNLETPGLSRLGREAKLADMKILGRCLCQV